MMSKNIPNDPATVKPPHALPFVAALCLNDEAQAIAAVRSGTMPVADIISWGSGRDAEIVPPL